MRDIPIDKIKEFLDYSPVTGIFTWKKKAGQTSIIGREAGSKHHTGYKTFRLDGSEYMCHRAAWAISNGVVNFGEIDHINGDRSDNRIENLRIVSRSGNQQNKALNSNNTTGHTGVYKVKGADNYYRVIITKDRARYGGHYFGYDRACQAYRELKHMLHDTHGQYVSRLNEYRVYK